MSNCRPHASHAHACRQGTMAYRLGASMHTTHRCRASVQVAQYHMLHTAERVEQGTLAKLLDSRTHDKKTLGAFKLLARLGCMSL